MAKCDICDKKITNGRRISISRSQVSRRAKRSWKPNVKKIKINDNGTIKTIHVCMRCLRASKRTNEITRAL